MAVLINTWLQLSLSMPDSQYHQVFVLRANTVQENTVLFIFILATLVWISVCESMKQKQNLPELFTDALQ